MPSHNTVSRSSSRGYLNLAASKWAGNVGGLRHGPKSLLRALAARSDKFGCCWPKQGTLSAELGCSVRSIRSYVRDLEGFGMVRSIGRCHQLTRNSNVYHLLGWPGRQPLPAWGHSALGQYIKEPSEKVLLDAIRRQTLLAEAAKSAERNNIPESLTTSAEEEMLKKCLEALGDWVTRQEQDLLREDWPALRDIINQGYPLDTHVLPVLTIKAQAGRTKGLVRSWNYFAKPIAEYDAEEDKKTKKATESQPLRDSKHLTAAKEEERNRLEKALADLTRGRSRREQVR